MLSAAILLAAATAAPPAAPPAYVLQTTSARRVEAVNTFTVRYPRATVEEWVIAAPRLPELPGQTKVATVLDPEGKAVEEASDLKRPIVFATVPVKTKEQATAFTYKVTYQALLQARKLVPYRAGTRRPVIAPLAGAERRAALATSATAYDYDATSFSRWLDDRGLRRTRGDDDVTLARRIFQEMKKTCSYEPRALGLQSASTVAKAGRSNSAGLAVLFAAACRANQIPARCLIGKGAQSMKPPDKPGDSANAMQHIRAEFFAEGVGWVPVDVVSAIASDAGTGPEFFGQDRGDFITLHVDFDLVVETDAFGKQTVPWLTFGCWVVGSGAQEGVSIKEDWQVKPIK
jgi:transglutaminase-like putative cysteine protease